MTILDNSNILKYRANENLFAGLIVYEDSDQFDILSAYEEYVDNIFLFYIDSKQKDEISIEEDIKNRCKNELQLPINDTEDLLSAFNSFFFIR